MIENGNLDQLWYTWSTAGLGSMQMGYRVRAASEGLYETQSMRYRRIDHYLRYELPQGININDFDTRTAPTSFAFVFNGEERLLVRKVFKGRDAAGRNSVFFTHLIAGLPPTFTARDAIRLWYCPNLWVESEQGKPANDTRLNKISYSELQAHVQQSQTQFNVLPVAEQLQTTLVQILSQGLPAHIYTSGQPIFTATLIYGLTHCLPMTLLKGLTFSTYESVITESDITIVGTLSGADLGSPTNLRVQIGPGNLPPQPLSVDMQNYAKTAIDCLIMGDMTKFNKMVSYAENHTYESPTNLIDLYKRRYRQGPLTLKQVEDIVTYPEESLEDLLDPRKQQESVALIIKHRDYWIPQTSKVFNQAVNRLDIPARNATEQKVQEALKAFINGMASCVLDTMQTILLQYRENDRVVLEHCGDVLLILAPLAKSPQHWYMMINDFAKGQVFAQATSNPLWFFHRWLLEKAKFIQPRPSTAMMQPWLDIPAWQKLHEVLSLELPAEWEQEAMLGILKRNIPKSAVVPVMAYKATFLLLLQQLLQQRNPASSKLVIRFFAAMVEHEYPDRVSLLLALLNTFPKEADVIEQLFAIVRLQTQYQLVAPEIDTVLAGCSPEVILACGRSPSLAEYVQTYILSLTPGKINNLNVAKLLGQLDSLNAERSPALPDAIANLANLVSHWLIISNFLKQGMISREGLKDVRIALQNIFQSIQRTQPVSAVNQVQIFAHEFTVLLVDRVKNESDLGIVVEVLGQPVANSSWDLLYKMAAIAGQNYAQQLNRLLFYANYSISKYDLMRQPPNVLDSYLQVLFGRVDEDALKKIDAAVKDRLLYDEVQIAWKGWRDREKATKRSNMPFGNIWSGAQKQSPGLQPNQPNLQGQYSPQNVAPVATYAPPRGDFSQGQQVVPSGPLVLKGQPDSTHYASSMGQQSPAAPTGRPPLFASIMIGSYQEVIATEYYARMCLVFPHFLPYWLNHLEASLISSKQKSLAFEIATMHNIQQEFDQLNARQAGIYLKLIGTYLIDDVLIREGLKQRAQQKNFNAGFFNVDQYLPGRLKEFSEFTGMDHYQQLCNHPQYTEQGLREALQKLILRDLFIRDLDSDKKTMLENWLKAERNKAKIEYIEQG